MKHSANRLATRLSATLFVVAFLLLNFAKAQQASGDLSKIADGGHLEKWLISNDFPAEIDAGMWENFNRFNIENLPQKDWLKPFPKPQIGTFSAQVQPTENPKSQIPNPKPNNPLPEIGAASVTKVFPDAVNVVWKEFSANDLSFDFYNHFGGKIIGTAYLAGYVNAANAETKFIETDGFLGAIWLNGEKIYDGYSLTLKKIATANFKRGENLLIVRASGVSGDYWRKNGGWTANIKFWNSRQSAENSARFKPLGNSGQIFYLEGFHVDPVYLHDQRGYAKITLSNTAQYVRNLRSDARYGVFLSEIDYLKPHLDTNPQDREFLREAVKQGRVGTGGAYNQFNENTIGGEAIIRNILYGQAMHQAMLGRKSESLALWDVFGHAPQLSQIAEKSGFTGVVWSKKITGFQPFFYDYALDGSRLLHRRVDYAYSFSGFGSGKNYSFDNFRKMTERKFQEAQSFNSATDLRINAADFTPPWTNLAGNVETLETQKPQIRVSGQAQDLYFRELNKEIASGKVRPPVSSRDKLFFHVGVGMARSDLKIGQRVAENATLTAEKFGSIAYLLGAKYPDLALDKAWRHIFFGSHHDAITGTPSDNALLDLVHGYREAYELSNDALQDSLKFIAKQINTKSQIANRKSQIPVVVFNPMNWTRSDVAKVRIFHDELLMGFNIYDEKGNQVNVKINGKDEKHADIEFIAKDLPSVGYKTFYLATSTTFRSLEVLAKTGQPQNVIENEFYKITVDAAKGGAISSIYDKQAKREIINTKDGHYANQIASLREELTRKNVIYPAWELWTTGEKRFSTEKPAKVSWRQRGDTEVLTIEGELPNMEKFLQTIELYKGIKRIDFKTELVDYKGKDELFVVNFPLNLSGGALVTEDRFGTVVRNSSKGFLDFRTNTDKLVSGAPVYSVNNWAEYGSTFNLNFVSEPSVVADGLTPNKVISSVPFKPLALVRPHGENFENLTEKVVANFIKRGVSVTPFYDDNDAERRKNLPIEDSTMPKNLNDDVAYHNFRIALGTEKENAYSAKILKQVSAETRAKFEARLTKEGLAFLFLYDADVPKDFPKMPVLLIAANSAENYGKAIETLIKPITENKFAVDLPFESFAVETYEGNASGSPAMSAKREQSADYSNSQAANTSTLPSQSLQASRLRSDLPQVPDYGVALINNGTAGVSLEKGNVLTLFLTHTAIFPGVNLPFEFVPEHKTHVFHYSLYPHSKDWREADTVKVGYDVNNPLIAIQTDVHDGNLPSEKSFLEMANSKLVLSTLKLGDNPQANFESVKNENQRPVIFRFYESEGKKNTAQVNTGFDISTFAAVDLLENKKSVPEIGLRSSKSFGISADAFGIETIQLKPRMVQSNSQILGLTKEAIQPVFSRYWMHNAGVAPIGNDAVKVSLRPLEQQGELSTFAYDDKYNQGGTTTIAVRVQVVNNYQDRRVSGEVFLEVPEDWRVVPSSLKYDIAPNGSFVQDVSVLAFPVKKDLEFNRASGLIKAKITHDGQTFQDVLNIGKTLKLDWTTEQTVTETIIKIKNPHRQQIEGAVALITPPETWYFQTPKFPREIGFAVKANSETILRFNHGEFPAGTWRIARIAYNGNVEYKK